MREIHIVVLIKDGYDKDNYITRMLTEQYDLIEQLESAHKFHQTHAQIRKVTGRGKNAGITTCIEDRDGNIIMEQ